MKPRLKPQMDADGRRWGGEFVVRSSWFVVGIGVQRRPSAVNSPLPA
jgi:hypothetical protein